MCQSINKPSCIMSRKVIDLTSSKCFIGSGRWRICKAELLGGNSNANAVMTARQRRHTHRSGTGYSPDKSISCQALDDLCQLRYLTQPLLHVQRISLFICAYTKWNYIFDQYNIKLTPHCYVSLNYLFAIKRFLLAQ